MQSDESTSGDTSSDGPQNSNVTAKAPHLAATMPVFLRGNDMEFGLSSYEETANVSASQAAQV